MITWIIALTLGYWAPLVIAAEVVMFSFWLLLALSESGEDFLFSPYMLEKMAKSSGGRIFVLALFIGFVPVFVIIILKYVFIILVWIGRLVILVCSDFVAQLFKHKEKL